MAVHGKATSVVLGAFDLSALLHSITTTEATDVADTTGFQQEDKTYLSGINDTKITMQGRFEGVAGSVDDYIRNQVQAQVHAPFIVGLGSMGYQVGQTALFGLIDYTQFAVTAPMDGLVSLTGDAIADGGLGDGLLAADGTPISTDTITEAVQVPLNGARWALAVALLTNTWSGSIVVTVQSSPEGATWADVGDALTLAPGVPDSGLIIGGTTTDSYFRAVITLGAGSGEVAPLVAIGRY